MAVTTTPNTDDDPLVRQRRSRGSLRRLAVVLLLVLAVLGAGTFAWIRGRLDPGAAVVGVSEVAVRDNAFAPAAIEVPAGTTVTWRWEGEELHNVVGEGFESPTQAEGEFAQRFADPGAYPYQCTLHFFMRGEVVVD